MSTWSTYLVIRFYSLINDYYLLILVIGVTEQQIDNRMHASLQFRIVKKKSKGDQPVVSHNQ